MPADNAVRRDELSRRKVTHNQSSSSVFLDFAFAALRRCPSCFHGFLSRRDHTSHHHPFETILLLSGVPVFITHVNGESGFLSELLKGLIPCGYRQESKDIAIAIGGLIAVLAQVPTEHA